LALKHYTPSFRSTTKPYTRSWEIEQTAIYFNPQLDIVHVADEFGSKLQDLFLVDEETIRSIKTLAIGIPSLRAYLAAHLLRFASLETLILAAEGEVGKDEETLIRENMEDNLVMFKNFLLSKENRIHREWNLPAVKVMSPQTLESQFWL
jgi:hypothetical protein